MPQPTLEICSFTASQGLVDNPSLTHPVYELASFAEGLRHVYEGIGIEDDKKRWAVMIWDSYEHHKSLIDSAAFPEVVKKMEPCIGGDFQSHHVIFTDDVTVALTAPVTEFGLLKLKDSSTKDEFIKVMNELVDHSRKVSGEIRELRHQPFVFGEAREEPGLFYFVAGWESVEDHLTSTNNPAGNKRFAGEIGRLVDVVLTHTRMRKYSLRNERL